jgi:hypothetical protein
VKIRVHFQDESSEDYDANHVEIAGDGSLLLAHKTQRESGVVDASGRKALEITQRLVRIIRRDLWAEVELVDVGEPEVITLGGAQRELARAVN